MIQFFRKIRQKLLSEGNTGKYLKYALGEIILVVIGILIALSINNWNEDRKSEARKQDYYVQLLDDLNNDIISAEKIIEEFSDHQKKYKDYLSLYDTEGLTPLKAYRQITGLPLISTPLTFNTNTIESLQNSGDIGLIPPSIRNKLMDLRRLQNLTIQRFEVTDEGQRGITQKLSSLLGATTLPGRLENQPEMKAFLHIDENVRELILEFEGIHRWKSVSQNETIDRLESMIKDINAIIVLINKELENKNSN